MEAVNTAIYQLEKSDFLDLGHSIECRDSLIDFKLLWKKVCSD